VALEVLPHQVRCQRAICEQISHYINGLLVVHAASKKAHMKTTRIKGSLGGFTLVEIMIVIAIIGLLCAIAIPNYVRARSDSQANACINNMRQIDGALQQYAFENGKTVGAPVTFPSDLTPYLRLNVNSQIPLCPAGGSYTVAPVGITPSVVCSLGSNVTPAHVQ